LLPMEIYLHKAPTLPLPYPSTSIVPSRGCFGNCRFCQPTLRGLFGRKMRYRSPENVVDEILQLKHQYGIRGLFFADDEPTWNKEWMEAFSQEMIDRKVNIRWICPSRVDTVDLDMLQIMKRAGCIQVGFGVETGSQRVMNYYRKGTRVEQVVHAFELCRQVGIIARANIMIGAPEETAQDVQETIRLIKEIKPDLIAVSVTTPIVGTDLYHHAKLTGLLRKASLSDYDRFYIGTMKRTLSDDEIRGYIREIVAAYRTQIIQDLRNLQGLSRRKHLLIHSALHWITMLANPRMLLHDIIYYLRYDRKEKD
ncbi:MAG: radical SAM protein, partial [Anaerolineales bacterium]